MQEFRNSSPSPDHNFHVLGVPEVTDVLLPGSQEAIDIGPGFPEVSTDPHTLMASFERQPQNRTSGYLYESEIEIGSSEYRYESGPLADAEPISQVDLPAVLSQQNYQNLPKTSQIRQTSQNLRFPPQAQQISQKPPSISVSTVPTLFEALNATMAAKQANRVVVIPGSRKRTQRLPETDRQARGMNPVIKFMATFVTLFLVIFTTLVTLAPVDSLTGQSNVPVVGNVNNWVRAEVLDWKIKGRVDQVAKANTGNPVGGNVQAKPIPKAQLPADLPKSQYIQIAEQEAKDAGIDPVLFVRQIQQESGFDVNAASDAGAVGIAQFLPSTAAALGIDPHDPIQALRGAALLMADYNKTYNGNYSMALAAYNAGSGNLQTAVNSCGANYLTCLPAETQNYVNKIINGA